MTQSQAARSLITVTLCGSLLVTAVVLIFRSTIVRFYRSRFPGLVDRRTAIVTVITGVILAALVTISSIGAGAIGVCALVILYPQLPMRRIVGSDIAHAVPFTLVAGVGHWMIGTVDAHIIAALLVGSLPGIILGSYFAVRVAEHRRLDPQRKIVERQLSIDVHLYRAAVLLEFPRIDVAVGR